MSYTTSHLIFYTEFSNNKLNLVEYHLKQVVFGLKTGYLARIWPKTGPFRWFVG